MYIYLSHRSLLLVFDDLKTGKEANVLKSIAYEIIFF